MKFLFFSLGVATFCLCLGVFVGFAGRVNPAFDSLALLRPLMAAACLLILVFPMGRKLRLLVLCAAVAGLITTVPLFFGGQEGGDLRIYSKNLLYRNLSLPELTDDIIASGAEVVTLQEVSRRNWSVMTLLEDALPYQHLCQFSGWSGVAVLSRYPMQSQACSTERGVAVAQIDKAGQGVWIASVHLTWPYPYSNARTAASVHDVLVDLDGPVVMAGDFNIFPWAASIGGLKRAAGLKLVQPIRPTLDLEGIPLFLDHVYAPGGGVASYRPLMGSDHKGVLADVWLAPR